jgi:hypothetical protein
MPLMQRTNLFFLTDNRQLTTDNFIRFFALMLAWTSLASAQPPALENRNWCVPPIDVNLRFQGSTSCAASACHGGQESDARPNYILRNEYSIWSGRDPHSRAYQSLSNARSRQILTRLGIRSTDSEYQNCLACHNPQQWGQEQTDKILTTSSRREGVGCEACHGPAERWRTKHYLSDWNQTQAERSGMVDTDNLLIRARRCADCHVGSPNGEVNHDLLAAGHPPLRFDYAALLQRMPKHWNERRAPPPAASTVTSDPAAVHIAAADAALELLAARSGRNADQRVWPEFATARCASCHHELTPALATATTRPNLAANALRYEDEFATWIEKTTADAPQGSTARQLHSTLNSLRQTMNSGAVPDATAIHRLATSARDELHAWIAETYYPQR